ncbi:hypothetical protein N7474_000633 [Penicillium riverlandense]|uniref:uncharacterized protein n=1 Tax=Penicillium riverlandense TaxID=1903569 RepID=UPI0025499F26|nr:uncharacterized protein N7474_000633 [Penicillium riverlandense]KAJ5832322.1 hypothetical protein N7474_000633 [Penicillium riverlandense]
MRPPLHKPGAIPLLALVVFSLLSLVPSLPSIYSLKFADFGYYYGSGARQAPLIKDGLAHIPSEISLQNADRRKALIRTSPHRSRVNRLSRTSRLETDASVPTSTDVPSVDNRSQLSYLYGDSSMFIRPVRTFRSYFSQQLDASNRGASASETQNSCPAISVTNSSTSPTSHDPFQDFYYAYRNQSFPWHQFLNDELALQLPAHLSHFWQQVCRVAIDLWPSWTGSRPSFSVQRNKEDHPITKEDQKPASIDHSRPARNPEDETQPLESPTIVTDDSEDIAAGRHSENMRGSCMAIVIGLVAGIILF